MLNLSNHNAVYLLNIVFASQVAAGGLSLTHLLAILELPSRGPFEIASHRCSCAHAMGERRSSPMYLLCHAHGSSRESHTPEPSRYDDNCLCSKGPHLETTVSTCYSPVLLEQDSSVNNGSGISCGLHSVTKDPALQIPFKPPLSPRRPHKMPPSGCFQDPYRTRTSMQGDVYNFLERPAGLRCFFYHFLV